MCGYECVSALRLFKKSAALWQILAEIRNSFCFQIPIVLKIYICIKVFVLESLYKIKSSQTITKYFKVYFVFISCCIISTASATTNEELSMTSFISNI